MCQGAIVSLVKFKKGKRLVRVPVSGIGSHSELIKANTLLLKRRGWNENLPGQEVISVESDFTKGWNYFTVESGQPDKSDMAILRRKFKTIAGSASALIRHVKRCGRIDDALVALLTASAWAEYEKVRAPAWAEYEKVTAPAWAEYEKVRAPALAEYEKVRATAWAEYEKVTAPALAEYEKVRAPAWCKLFAKKENRVEGGWYGLS